MTQSRTTKPLELVGSALGRTAPNLLSGEWASVPVPVVSVDAMGLIRAVNQLARQLLRVDAGSRMFGRWLAPGSMAQFHRFLLRLVASGEQDTTTLELVLAGGNRWFNVSGCLVSAGASSSRCLMTLVDVTEHLVAQRQQASSERQLRRILELLPSAVLIALEGRIVFSNHAARRLLAIRDPSALDDRSLRDFVVQADQSAFDERIRLLETSPPAPVELRLVDAKDHQRVVELVHTWTRFDGDPARMFVIQDVTERRQLEAEVAQTDRLRTIATLAAGVAHEVNNPLTFLLFALEESDALVSDAERDYGRADSLQPLRRYIAEAREGAHRVGQIVRDLRDYSRADATPSTVGLRAAVERAVQLAGPQLKHRAALVIDVDPTLQVSASEGRMVQVFLNLLLNAGNAIPAGGPDRNRIAVEARVEGDVARISFSDTGCGIPEEIRQRVFEPFFTTHAPGEGSGLGLFVCFQYIEEWGGSVQVESDGASWTRFSVTIPLAATPDPATRSQREPAQPLRLRRVLVVDDEPLVLRGIVHALSETADEIVTATDGAEARDILLSESRFDAVICDLHMPRMTGSELWAWVERRDADLAARFLFVTGGAFAPAQRTFVVRHQERVLQKPFTPTQLREAAFNVSRRVEATTAGRTR